MRLPIHAIADPDAKPDFVRADLEHFWKEVVCEGSFVHPDSGQVIEIDKPRMDRWVNRLAKMKEEKILPTLPYGHRNLFNDKENAGFLDSLEVRQREDGRFGLWGLFDVPKATDAENIGTTIRGTSIGVNFNLKTADGAGGIKEWGEVIDHVALTNHPVVSDTEGFQQVEEEPVPAGALSTFRSVYSVADGDEAVLRFAHLSRADLAASEKLWGEADKAMLPASCHLHVGDLSDRSTWKLPVYEGAGALVDGPGGGKVFARRGALNLGGLRAAAATVAGARGGIDLAVDETKAVAKDLVRLLRENEIEPTDGLRKAAGMYLSIDSSWLEQVAGEIAVPTLKALFHDREMEDQLWRATSALNEVLRRVTSSDTLTGEEKKARIDGAVEDFKDLFVALEPTIGLDAVRAELLALARVCPTSGGGGLEVRGDTKRTDPEDDEMKIKDLITKLKPAADRFGLSLGEDADESAVDACLESILGRIPPAEQPETEREKAMRIELEQIKTGNRISAVRTAKSRAKALLERGSITRKQHAALEKLLTADSGKVFHLAMEGEGEKKAEVLKDEEVDVAALALEFAEAIPAQGAFGGRLVVPEVRDDGSDEGKKRGQAVRSLLSHAGANPETGEVGGARTG